MVSIQKKWGWKEGDPGAVLAQAEVCAEAASGLDRGIVSVASLAHRRFRTEGLEPLLKAAGEQSGKGRLDDALTELLKSTSGDRAQLVQDTAHMVRMCGIQSD
ncbi:hypothetical protein DENSPDRAFT_840903, partial [Dentipellis sp. KUC8613]